MHKWIKPDLKICKVKYSWTPLISNSQGKQKIARNSGISNNQQTVNDLRALI